LIDNTTSTQSFETGIELDASEGANQLDASTFETDETQDDLVERGLIEQDGEEFEGEGSQEVPEAYELEAPGGFAIDPQALAAATPVFKELGLSNEQANKLMPVAAKFAAGLSDKLNAQILNQVRADRKAWLDTAMADREIGGANWKQTLAKGAFALDNLGFPKGSPFRVLLDESGLGNHPEMIRAWAKVGRAIGEDGDFVRGTGSMHARRDTAETLYPNDAPKV